MPKKAHVQEQEQEGDERFERHREEGADAAVPVRGVRQELVEGPERGRGRHDDRPQQEHRVGDLHQAAQGGRPAEADAAALGPSDRRQGAVGAGEVRGGLKLDSPIQFERRKVRAPVDDGGLVHLELHSQWLAQCDFRLTDLWETADGEALTCLVCITLEGR